MFAVEMLPLFFSMVSRIGDLYAVDDRAGDGPTGATSRSGFGRQRKRKSANTPTPRKIWQSWPRVKTQCQPAAAGDDAKLSGSSSWRRDTSLLISFSETTCRALHGDAPPAISAVVDQTLRLAGFFIDVVFQAIKVAKHVFSEWPREEATLGVIIALVQFVFDHAKIIGQDFLQLSEMFGETVEMMLDLFGAVFEWSDLGQAPVLLGRFWPAQFGDLPVDSTKTVTDLFNGIGDHWKKIQELAWFVGEAACPAGTSKEDGLMMVCPLLLAFVANEIERVTGILKQVRKAHEERKALSW